MLEIKASVVKEMHPQLKGAWTTLLKACPVDGVVVTPNRNGLYSLTDEQISSLREEPGTKKGLRLFQRAYQAKVVEIAEAKKAPAKRPPAKKAPIK